MLTYPADPIRRPSESFSTKARTALYLMNAASHPDGQARCVLCKRPVLLHGPRTGPLATSVAVAGHIVSRQDGGRPILENGRIECTGCSRAEGRRRYLLAVNASRRRRAGLPPKASPRARALSTLGEWLQTIENRL